jgi:serine/threonine protein kinase
LEIIEDVEETFLILDWCEHGDLLALVNMYEFTEKEAREVVLQILSALEYSYRKGWAHLDVK